MSRKTELEILTQATSTQNPVAKPDHSLAIIRPYVQSKYPAAALTVLFGIASFTPYTVFPRHAYIAPFLHRVGFASLFGAATHAISIGDTRNGSGIATAWSLSYLVLHLRNTLKAPRNPLALTMAGGAAACASIYGTEYFVFQS